MEYIVILYLNEIGRKAFKTDTKELAFNIFNGEITEDVINDKFPMELVERFEIIDSFLNLSDGDYVCVVDTDGKRYLGEITGRWNRQISVKINGKKYDGYYYSDNFCTFRPNGVEATHSKNKLHIERITPEEVEKMKEALRHTPYINIIKSLLDGNTVALNYCDDIRMPEWLSFDTIEKIQELIDSDLHTFDENC